MAWQSGLRIQCLWVSMSGLPRLDTGAAVVLDSSNVAHHNSLQVANAERFVFSCNDDFSLAREMLQQQPELKGRPRTV